MCDGHNVIQTFLFQCMVTGLPGQSGVTVPSRVEVEFKDVRDHVQIHLPRMADKIALANQRRFGDATHKDVQVTFIFLVYFFFSFSK